MKALARISCALDIRAWLYASMTPLTPRHTSVREYVARSAGASVELQRCDSSTWIATNA